jgi:glycosyltransferase involved in cell wall biosynthesis
MRILLVHRFFWPDSPPYAVILNEMAKMLIAHDYQVDVLSSIPSYKSVSDSRGFRYKEDSKEGFKVYRLKVFNDSQNRLLKIFNFMFFPLQVFFFILFRRKYDVVTVSSSPPVILAFCIAVCSKIKGFSMVYHCMDLHPEIGKISGDFRNRLLFRLLQKMELFSCHVAKKIIVLSEDMKSSMVARDPALIGKTVIINNFSLPAYEQVAELPHELRKKESIKRLVFAGNLGRFQGLDTIVRSLLSFGHADKLELYFVGEGSYLKPLKDMASESKNIHFLSHQSVPMAKLIIENADFGIVSLDAGVIKYAFPSKTMTYLESGTPILFCCGDNCEFASFLQITNLGYFANLTDEDQLHTVFKKIIDNEDSILDSNKLKDFYEHHFAQHLFDKKLQSLFSGLDA